MSIASIQLERGHILLERFDGETVTFRGKTLPALVSNIRTGRSDAQGGGVFQEVSGTVSIRRSLLESPPEAGEEITIRGRVYFVGTTDEDSAAYEFPVSATDREG